MRSKLGIIASPPDPDAPEDCPVSVAGLECGLMGRRVRMLRNKLGLSQEAFAKAYGIPLGNIRQYESGRHVPSPAVRACLNVIEEEEEAAARGCDYAGAAVDPLVYRPKRLSKSRRRLRRAFSNTELGTLFVQ